MMARCNKRSNWKVSQDVQGKKTGLTSTQQHNFMRIQNINRKPKSCNRLMKIFACGAPNPFFPLLVNQNPLITFQWQVLDVAYVQGADWKHVRNFQLLTSPLVGDVVQAPEIRESNNSWIVKSKTQNVTEGCKGKWSQISTGYRSTIAPPCCQNRTSVFIRLCESRR